MKMNKVLDKEIEVATNFTKTGRLVEAEKIYLTVLGKEANYPPALYGLSVLADKINDQEVREDLLRHAINGLAKATEPQLKSLAAAWLTELAESLIKQNKTQAAQKAILRSKKLIEENL